MVNHKNAKLYDFIAEDYEDYSNRRSEYLESIEQIVTSYLIPKTRLLDVGSGDGRRLEKIMRACKISDVVAIEPSSKMANICKKRLKIRTLVESAENINSLNIGKFNAVTLLWNVIGHIPTEKGRLKALKGIVSKLKPDGIVLLDVNNRHNAPSYGFWRVMYRRFIDFLNFDAKRGDAHFTWRVNGRKIPGYGHLFTPEEIEALIYSCRLQIKYCCTVNYENGRTSHNKTMGQLFYVLERQ